MTELLDEIAKEILGTSDSESAIIDKYELPIDEDNFLCEMLDRNVEYCNRCGTLKESCEMSDEQESICLDCLEYFDEELS